jgi:hypothetical protein
MVMPGSRACSAVALASITRVPQLMGT